MDADGAVVHKLSYVKEAKNDMFGPFPSARVELLLMRFNVHKRSGSDNPKVSEISVFAVQGFARSRASYSKAENRFPATDEWYSSLVGKDVGGAKPKAFPLLAFSIITYCNASQVVAADRSCSFLFI